MMVADRTGVVQLANRAVERTTSLAGTSRHRPIWELASFPAESEQLRRAFNPGALTAEQIGALVVRLHHDEDAEVYINGVRALAVTGYTLSYEYAFMSDAAKKAIVSNGANTLAVHCHQTAGGQYIDAGLAVLGL